jgi:hypothetical protein
MKLTPTMLRQIERQHKDPYRDLTRQESARVLAGAMALCHPAVNMPKGRTFGALLRANHRRDFLRRLAASNN